MQNRLEVGIWRKAAVLLIAIVVLLTGAGGLILPGRASAAPYAKLGTRRLTIGSSTPGAVTDYKIDLSWQGSTNIGSIKFIVCEDYVVDVPCPNSLSADMSGANLIAASGLIAAGFTIDSASPEQLIIARPSAALTGTGMYSFTFDNIVNPAGLQQRFYIQIFTYSSTDATGTPTHMSSVASATAEPIVINTEVPPILYFCAALSITQWCDSANGNQIDYGDLLDAGDNYGTSQFGVATNALGGYVVTINGKTMTSGNKEIEALAAPTARALGIAQFGLNLRANTDPATGADVNGIGIGVVAADYNTPDMYKYVDGDIVATAATGTMFDTYTVTYIVNVPPDQPSGIYNTTITYICTAAF